MHRQRVGLIVICSAVLLVAVITGLRPDRVAGVAQATAVAGPPAVGECVVDPLPKPQLGVTAPVLANSGGTVPVYPAQQIQPCTGARYGEITAVIAAPKPTVVTGDDTDGRFLNDPNEGSCSEPAQRYLGTTTEPTQSFWQGRILQFSVALSRPSTRQEAAGQRWAACIVTLPASDQVSAPPRYGSSLRDAVHTGRYRDQLGDCISNFDWDGGLISCTQLHLLEVMGWGDSGDHPVTGAQLESSCQQLVRQLTAMPDPTAGGALSIQIGAKEGNRIAIRPSQVPAHSAVSCGVTTANRELRGSLLGLGRQPIPWA